jgi:hypothetical protein
MPLGSKPRYDNSTSPSRIISAGCLSLVSFTIASHVDLSEGDESFVYSEGAPLRGVGKDEGEIVVNNFEVAEGKFVPYTLACCHEAKALYLPSSSVLLPDWRVPLP